MARFLARRLLLALVTLWLLVTIVFIISNVLPRDVGRTILGPFAPQESVDALNERLGTNRPLLRPLRRVDPGHRHPRLRGVVRVRTAGAAADPRGGRPLGQAGRPRPAHHDPAEHRRRAVRRETHGTARSDRAIVLLGVTSSSIPEFITGDDPRRRRRRPARLAAGPRDAAAGRGHPRPRSATC